MREFFTVFKFEFNNYVKSKPFIILTLVLILIIGGVLTYPRFKDETDGGDSGGGQTDITTVALVDHSADSEETAQFFNNSSYAYGYTFTAVDASEEVLKENVANGVYDAAVIVNSSLSYQYVVNNVEMTDNSSYVLNSLITAKYRYEQFEANGVSAETTQQILSANPSVEVIQIGKNQQNTFFYTYILVFALYMAIMLYGQFVATSVASEKSSRAMEMLITSANTTNLMFGKVLGSGMAGLFQMSSILASAYIFFRINQDYLGSNGLVESIFGMPLYIVLYTILFFLLGFFMYAFMYGALGSLASRSEDIGVLTMPVTIVFVLTFILVVRFMASGGVDSIGMKILSYIPLTAPMAMFARISMSNVPPLGIIISVASLTAFTLFIGYFASSIYKIGVLMYGKPPKPGEIFKLIRAK